MSGDSGLDGFPSSLSAAARLLDVPPVGDDALVLVPYSLLTPAQLAQALDVRSTRSAPPEAQAKWVISVYIDDGVVFDYEVASMASAREHAGAIQTLGYRSVSKDAPDVATYFPVHRIRKVKVTGPTPMPTAYTDTARGT